MTDGRVIGGYLSVSWTSNSGYVDDTNAFLYDGEQKYSAQHGHWGAGKYASYMNSNYYPTFGGGHDLYIGGQTMYMNAYSFVLPDRSAPFKRKGWGAYTSANLRDIEVYSVDAKIFPRTNPPDYARRLRTMPVGENVTASMDKCAQMCNDTDECGGFVYTKASAGGGDGKCELKDRAKMFPVGVRVADPSKQLMLKVPMINAGIGDNDCRVNNGKYTQIDTARYAHYPDTGAMTSGTKCSMSDIIPKEGTLTAPSTTEIVAATNDQIGSTTKKINEYREQTTVSASGSESFTTVREGATTYYDAMKDVSNNLLKIANANYQRERLLAMTQETNNLLMAESYKFILWSVLAILAVLALLKIKEMFGQDDADSGDGGDGEGGGGILATILGWFGVLKSSTNTSDIADRTEDVKAALSSAGEQLKETGEQVAAGITEGADNLVASANQAMEGAVEGAKGIANKVSETATDAVNKMGDAVASATSGAAPAAPAAASGSSSGSAVKTGGASKRRK
jgi:hypothetical protein